jgi:hypothetical protein
MSQISSTTWVTGWSPPRQRARPGRVRSSRGPGAPSARIGVLREPLLDRRCRALLDRFASAPTAGALLGPTSSRAAQDRRSAAPCGPAARDGAAPALPPRASASCDLPARPPRSSAVNCSRIASVIFALRMCSPGPAVRPSRPHAPGARQFAPPAAESATPDTPSAATPDNANRRRALPAPLLRRRSAQPSFALAVVGELPKAFGSVIARSARTFRLTSTPGQLQAVHEARVRQVVLPRRRVDADDPQLGGTRACGSCGRGTRTSTPLDRFLRRLVQVLAAAEVALGLLQDPVLALQAGDVGLYTRHLLLKSKG